MRSPLYDEWQRLVSSALTRFETPFFLVSLPEIEQRYRSLCSLSSGLKIRHWLSLKTHPVEPLLKHWLESGRSVEVVSEYELKAAIQCGFPAEQILVNGVGKHSWLINNAVPELRVHFDSLKEVKTLSSIASKANWKVGLRCHSIQEWDPDDARFGGQFGLIRSEVSEAREFLERNGCSVRGLHFHLGSDIQDLSRYFLAVQELSEWEELERLDLDYLDIGGGLPIEFLTTERSVELTKTFGAVEHCFPSANQIWMENGRYLTGTSTVLVLTVLDIKNRRECRYLICDGGRTNNALVSDWETHELLLLENRIGPSRLTTVCGPTCMAYDHLCRVELPSDIKIGDHLVWMHAGAYHLPWETRFSHGVAKILWSSDDKQIEIVRENDTPTEWWDNWKN